MTVSAQSPIVPAPDRGSRAAIPRLMPSPVADPRALSRLTDRAPLVCVQLLVVTLVLFQRFVIPGPISVAVPIVFGVLGVLCVRGHIVADLTRTGLYIVAVSACVLVTLLASTWAGLGMSLNSLALLVVVYLPFCCRLGPALRSRLPEVLELFQRLMIAAAIACVAQWAAQLAGWEFRDLLDVVPPQWLASTVEFNLSYPLYYGSSINKSNGVVFLEPSFASQFLALAIIIQLLLGRARWRMVLFGGALLTTLSGTGMLLLSVGLVVLALRRGGRWAIRASMAVALAVVVVSVSPAGSLLAERFSEGSKPGSSGHARFVAPYDNVLTAVSSDVPALLIGRGAGSMTRDVTFFNPLGIPANYPAVPKLVGEYGLPATVLFLAFVLTVFLRGVPSITLALMSCMLYFVLSSSLLQPPIVYVCWLLTGLCATAAPGDPARRWLAVRARRSRSPAARGSPPVGSATLW